MEGKPFKIEVSDAVLENLQRRLADTRWPDEIPEAGWDYGSNLAYIQELVAYWRSGFDWRAQERLINTWSHYKATVAAPSSGSTGTSCSPGVSSRSCTRSCR